jgi:hypothetical protein
MVLLFVIKGCHITDNALHRTCDVKFSQYKIWIDAISFTRLTIALSSDFTLNAKGLAAFIGIFIGEAKPSIE